ncbi:MAG TPA: L-sorbose 1-phosphate reductase, partial [Spirochaetota bacterium]|nr:L-sorbose 1-phosphate reductase [Spirochaetota bacterium]
LRNYTNGHGFDDVFVFAPVKPVAEQGDSILAVDGCLNFFAGPSDKNFKAAMNFYNVHYAGTHVVGTSGGNTQDMVKSLQLMAAGRVDPAVMVTHIGGLDAVVDTTLHLPQIAGGKKLIYTNVKLPLTAISDFKKKGEQDPFFAQLDRLTAANNGLWSLAAEEYLLQNAKKV